MTSKNSGLVIPLALAPQCDRHVKFDDDQDSSYKAMEPKSDGIRLPLQPDQSTSEHEEYVSLNVSRDSDEDRKKSVYHKTTEVGMESERE
jgi:hypothetical protein